VSRRRLLSPEFLTHGGLFDAEASSGLPLRIAFAGLWTVTDRRGLFRWKPRELKLAILPYDAVDFGAVLSALESAGFVQRYIVDDKEYGRIPSFGKWQTFHKHEKPSDVPEPSKDGIEPAIVRPNMPVVSTVAVAVTGASTGTPRPTAARVVRPTGPVFNLGPYLAAYTERFPGSTVPAGRFGKALKPLDTKHGPTETLRRWKVFLGAKGELGAEYFARTWSEWDNPPPMALVRNGVKPTAADQMRDSMTRIFTPASGDS
jgi:hypothetical protein